MRRVMGAVAIFLLTFVVCFTCTVRAQSSDAVPEEARKHFIKGTTLFKEAKTPEDFKQAADEFAQAAQAAPSWPEACYNLALAEESAGNYDSAISSFKRYQTFKLSDAEARSAQDKVYALEAKREKAKADEEKARGEAAKKAAEPSVEGRWYFKDQSMSNYDNPDKDFAITNSGGQWVVSHPSGMFNYDRVNVQGRMIEFRERRNGSGDTYEFFYRLILSEDGKVLGGTQRYFMNGSFEGEFNYTYYRR